VKIGGFLILETSLALLIAVSLWAVFTGSQDTYRNGAPGAPTTKPSNEQDTL
jgi:hypothetical protein